MSAKASYLIASETEFVGVLFAYRNLADFSLENAGKNFIGNYLVIVPQKCSLRKVIKLFTNKITQRKK